MKLIDGKSYKNKQGKVVRVALTHPRDEFPFTSVGNEAMAGMRFMADGRYVEDQTPCSDFDLVEEVSEPPMEKVQNKLDDFLTTLFTAFATHPDADFLVKFAANQRKEAVLTEEEILQQCICYVVTQSMMVDGRETTRINKTVAEGINALTLRKDWPNLGKIAKHACNADLDVLKALEKTGDTLVPRLIAGTQFRSDILNAGNAEFEKVITEHFKAQGVIVTFTKEQNGTDSTGNKVT
jgi:hypothetical protein